MVELSHHFLCTLLYTMVMNIGGILYIFNAFAFETYEEAELSCLNKLIEIVK